MRLKLTIILLVFLCLQATATPTRNPVDIINKVKANFLKVEDASADITLDYNLCLFGCAGHRQLTGVGYFKAPDRIKTTLDGITYFARGNRIRKIDKDGKKFYLKLVNATDASVGYHPGLITHNFSLKTIKDEPDEIVIEGIPKPGVLNNTSKVIFYIDPQRYLLTKFHAVLKNRFLSGTTNIDYEKIKGIWVPVGCHGRTAIQMQNFALVGVGFNLQSKNMKINTGLSNKFFEPGF